MRAKELVQRGIEGYKNFQAKRKEQARHDIPTRKNFLWLMDQLYPTQFTVQNANYYFDAYCLTYWDGRAWITDKELRIVQPTKIKDLEVLTRLSQRKGDIDGEETRIIVATVLIDKFGSKSYVQASTTAFVSIGESQSLYDKQLDTLSERDAVKVLSNAYRIAYQAMTRRSLPVGLEPIDPGVIQLKLQPQLV